MRLRGGSAPDGARVPAGRHADRATERPREVRLVGKPARGRDSTGASPAASRVRARATRRLVWKVWGSARSARGIVARVQRLRPATAASATSGTRASQCSLRCLAARRTAACSPWATRGPRRTGPQMRAQAVNSSEHRFVHRQARRLVRERAMGLQQRPAQGTVAEHGPAGGAGGGRVRVLPRRQEVGSM